MSKDDAQPPAEVATWLDVALRGLEDPNMPGADRARLAERLRGYIGQGDGFTIQCPEWCTRGQEHAGPDDQEHWTDRRELDGGLSVDLSVDGGRKMFTVYAGDHFRLQFMMPELAKFIAALVELMAEAEFDWKKTVRVE